MLGRRAPTVAGDTLQHDARILALQACSTKISSPGSNAPTRRASTMSLETSSSRCAASGPVPAAPSSCSCVSWIALMALLHPDKWSRYGRMQLSDDDQVSFLDRVHGASPERRMLPEQLNATWGLDSIDQTSLPLDAIYNFSHGGVSRVWAQAAHGCPLTCRADGACRSWCPCVCAGHGNPDNPHGVPEQQWLSRNRCIRCRDRWWQRSRLPFARHACFCDHRRCEMPWHWDLLSNAC